MVRSVRVFINPDCLVQANNNDIHVVAKIDPVECGWLGQLSFGRKFFDPLNPAEAVKAQDHIASSLLYTRNQFWFSVYSMRIL